MNAPIKKVNRTREPALVGGLELITNMLFQNHLLGLCVYDGTINMTPGKDSMNFLSVYITNLVDPVWVSDGYMCSLG